MVTVVFYPYGLLHTPYRFHFTMTSGNPETNSILLLKTTCLTEGFNRSFVPESIVSNITASFFGESTNSKHHSFDGPWNDLVTSSAFVCDMILLSEDSPAIFRFPHEEILPCEQDNMFVFPLAGEKKNSDSLKFQLGLSNCIWDVNMTSTYDSLGYNVRSSPFEVSADTASFQWSKGPESGLNSNILMTEASITIDLIPAQQFLTTLWLERLGKDINATGSLNLDEKSVDAESTRSDERVPSSMQEQIPPTPFTTTESSGSSAFKRPEFRNHIKCTSTHPHFGENQLRILQDMVQSELDEIDRLVFFIQVITGLLLLFLGWSLIENIFWPYRSSGSRSSAGIPSSIQPVNEEKLDQSFQFDSLVIDQDLLHSRQVLVGHGISEKSHKSNKDPPSETASQTNVQPTPASHGSSGNKGLYLSEALRASKGCVSNAQNDSQISTNDRFSVRPVPANVTPERWTSSSNRRQARNNVKLECMSGQTIPETQRRYIDEAYAAGSNESGARHDGIRTANIHSPSELLDASSFISDYWG